MGSVMSEEWRKKENEKSVMIKEWRKRDKKRENRGIYLLSKLFTAVIRTGLFHFKIDFQAAGKPLSFKNRKYRQDC